jgi:hypothetical protein
MISRWLAFAVILIGLIAGCETKTVRVDSRVVGQRLHERIQQVLERPAVDKAIDAFIEAVAADPVLQPAVAKLAVVFEDPKLLEVAGSVLERVQELPAMQVIVRETMAAHPDASLSPPAIAGTRSTGVTGDQGPTRWPRHGSPPWPCCGSPRPTAIACGDRRG